jgi:hypothetical protein
MNDNSAKPFGCLLGCTGIAAFLVIIFPGLAVVGYVMGIFPGIVLGAAPSLLIYLVAWWALRWATIRLLIGIGVKQLRSLRLAVNLSAAGFVIAVTVIVPTECNRPLDRRVPNDRYRSPSAACTGGRHCRNPARLPFLTQTGMRYSLPAPVVRGQRDPGHPRCPQA